MKPIYFATDHAGLELKNFLISYAESLGYVVHDLGAYEPEVEDDYPDYIGPLAEKVSGDPDGCFGVVIGGSGTGEALVANKYPSVRAAVCNSNNTELVSLAREHNNANVISFGARFVTVSEAELALKIFLETPFSEVTRHKRRLKKIESIEQVNFNMSSKNSHEI